MRDITLHLRKLERHGDEDDETQYSCEHPYEDLEGAAEVCFTGVLGQSRFRNIFCVVSKYAYIRVSVLVGVDEDTPNTT